MFLVNIIPVDVLVTNTDRASAGIILAQSTRSTQVSTTRVIKAFLCWIRHAQHSNPFQVYYTFYVKC